MTARLLCGEALEVLQTLPDGCVRCIVTSPPYWGLRDYGVEGQLGLERTPGEYVTRLVGILGEARRVLADDGTLWLNLGDSYHAAPKGSDAGWDKSGLTAPNGRERSAQVAQRASIGNTKTFTDTKPKDLVGIPWLVAFALRADGWYLRCDIIWAKPNPMPESITDRPTKSHEYLFLLSKSERYFYNAAAVAEPSIHAGRVVMASGNGAKNGQGANRDTAAGFTMHDTAVGETRNARSVWTISGQPYSGAHFATFPEEIARRCILAGSAPGDVVLDPFGGSGTVAQVATGNGREAIYIDLNPKYLELATQRIGPMLCEQPSGSSTGERRS